jgi:hypothetical protein
MEDRESGNFGEGKGDKRPGTKWHDIRSMTRVSRGSESVSTLDWLNIPPKQERLE